MKCLMLGSGNATPKRKIFMPETENAEIEWTTLDQELECKPQIVFNLDRIEEPITGIRLLDGRYNNQLPFAPDTFDEIHAYSVIGLYGRQGNAEGFFRGMRELWRILKPSGLFIGGTPAPNDPWAWGEPSARRVITEGTFKYLTRGMYERMGQLSQSDYRRWVDPCWWELVHSELVVVGGVQAYYWGLKKVS